MNCRRVQARLQAYLDGELAAAMSRRIETHKQGCLVCWREWQQARAFDVYLRELDSLPHVWVPAEFTARVLARLQDELG